MRKLICILILTITGCTPAKHLYRFHVTRYYPLQSSDIATRMDSVLAYVAISNVDTSQLLKYDRSRLEEFSFAKDLMLSYEDSIIVLKKYHPGNGDLKKLNHKMSTESSKEIPEIVRLYYYGIEAIDLDSAHQVDETLIINSLRKQKNQETGVGVALVAIIGLAIFISQAIGNIL